MQPVYPVPVAAPIVAPDPVPSLTPPVVTQVTDESWGGVFRANFPVLILVGMVILTYAMVVLAEFHKSGPDAALAFAMDNSKIFVGALVGALTMAGAARTVNRSTGGTNGK